MPVRDYELSRMRQGEQQGGERWRRLSAVRAPIETLALEVAVWILVTVKFIAHLSAAITMAAAAIHPAERFAGGARCL